MDRFGPSNFSTLQIKGHVLHRARAHLKDLFVFCAFIVRSQKRQLTMKARMKISVDVVVMINQC